MHVGKLPPLLPVIAQEMQLSRVETGWLLTLFQIALASMGIVGGLLADRLGRKRMMVTGLGVMALASMLTSVLVQGGDRASLIILGMLRGFESFGFLAAVLPGPGLLQSLVQPKNAKIYTGLWAAYMPIGMATGLAIAPILSLWMGWRSVWFVVGAISLLLAIAIFIKVPRDQKVAAHQTPIGQLLRVTLSASGPWILAFLFFCYAAQWMGLFGFLPTIYKEQGIAVTSAGWLTAIAVLSNAIGNIAAGSRYNTVSPVVCVTFAALVMALTSSIVLGFWTRAGIEFSFAARYAAVIAFSVVGGAIPGTIFGLLPRLAPAVADGNQAIGTSAGLFQQGSGLGQVLVPPLIAYVVQITGQWASAWWVMLVLGIGLLVAGQWLRFNGQLR